MWLIDANALMEAMSAAFQQCVWDGCESEECQVALETIMEAPTVDAVEVVRCKDCVYYEGHRDWPGGYCYHWDYEQGMSPNQVESDDFCSFGERRTE